MSQTSILLLLCFFVFKVSSLTYCDPSKCESGCCEDSFNCLFLYAESRTTSIYDLQWCYSGDCRIMNCGSTMCCKNGKCYDNDSYYCKSSSSSSSYSGSSSSSTSSDKTLLYVILPPACILTIILIFICIKRRRVLERHKHLQTGFPQNNANAPMPYNMDYGQGTANYPNNYQPQTFNLQQQQSGNYDPNMGNYNAGLAKLPGEYYGSSDNFQANYAIHQSNMGGMGYNNNNQVYGQPNQTAYQYNNQF